MCDVDGLHAQTVAGARVHESGAHTVEHFDLGVEDADRGEVLCVLYVVSFCVPFLSLLSVFDTASFCISRPCRGLVRRTSYDFCVSYPPFDLTFCIVLCMSGLTVFYLGGQTRYVQMTTKNALSCLLP